MKLSILTVGTHSNAEAAFGEAGDVRGCLLPQQRVFCAVDGWPQDLPRPACARLYTSAELLGDSWRDLAFFYPLAEYGVLCGLAAARCELADGRAVLWCRPGWRGMLPDCLPAGDTLCATPQPLRAPEEVPLAALRGEERHIAEGSALLLTPGERMCAFLGWCIDKMRYEFRRGFEANLAGEEIRIEHLQRRFAGDWAEYAPLFGCAFFSLPELADRRPAAPQQGRFDCFDDGTPIPAVLRDYYGKDYRLRQACDGDPFAHRPLFTDRTVITGDEHPVPLTAMANALYLRRDDLKFAFPHYLDSEREAFVRWFLDYGAREQALPEIYTAALRARLDTWKSQMDAAAVDRRTFSQKVAGRLRRAIGLPAPASAASAGPALPQGVNLCGFIKGDFGLGEATRILADTLQASGIPFTIVDFEGASAHSYTNTNWDGFITNEFRYNVNVMLTNADGLPLFRRSVSPDAFCGRYNIGFWYWELPEFPPEWQSSFTMVDEVWTSSEFTRAAIAAATDKPVTVIPCSLRETAREGMIRADFGLPENRFLFLMMYDARSYSARKNPEGAVEAFLQAFPQDDGRAGLVIKVNAPRGWDGEDELLDSLCGRSNIFPLVGTLPRDEVNSLVRLCDAFLSLHRSEGFGLGPAEAMYWGKPAVLTDWSGNQVYMRPGNTCAVPCTVVKLERDFGPYKKGCHWAQPDTAAAAQLMRRLVDDPDYRAAVAAAGQRTVREEFSPAAIGRLVRARLETLNLLQRKSEDER